MRRWFVVGLAAVACGRVGFQPVPGGDDGGARDGAPVDSTLVDGASAACPDTPPTCGLDTCSTDISCPYSDGSCCTCDGAGWVCLPPNPPACPPTPPTIGIPCGGVAGLQCGYCETHLYTCNGTIWINGGAPC